ncbi:MAG: carboxypeptidase M32 [Erysipelotrichia bacterium]|nr:carboxypeptidase M32 [Erysipelotrichia bacterium]
MNEALLKQYEEWVLKLSAYQMALTVIGIDKQTVAPSGGAAYRDERSSILAGELFSIETDPKQAEVRKQLLQETDLDEDMRRALQLYDREIGHILSVPKDRFIAFTKLRNESYEAWHRAKMENNYSVFEPYLKEIIEFSKEMYGYRSSDMPLYDQMLDDYEPGMNQKQYDVFFEKLKTRLVPLIQKVAKAEPIKDDFLFRTYPEADQKKYTEHLLKYLHFDPDWGYQNETEHPFTDFICENDCRTTTKYRENDVSSAILSTVHEVGHATYEHDVNPKYDGMILSLGISSGMHESQSRLFENCLGRTLPFWKANYPALQAQFPSQLMEVTAEQYTDAVNASKPTLIRTEADELTYPMHILIRYELEKGLFNGTISTEGLDQTWNQMYEKYLGISSPTATDGILQDVHWSDGNFGYFPTYALGSAFAAQFIHKMRECIDVDQLLETDRFDEIVQWLKQNIHTYGCRYDASEIMQKATGEVFNPDYYLDYLETKYVNLYHLV